MLLGGSSFFKRPYGFDFDFFKKIGGSLSVSLNPIIFI
jgi:hypothetical protein